MLARNLEETLKSSSEIKKVEKRSNYLAVEFKKTGITEYWKIEDGPERKRWVFDVPPNALSSNKPKLVKQFETNPLYEDEYEILKDHFCIQQISLEKAGFVNIRFMVHNLTHALYTQGWRDLSYTDDILDRDFEKLINADLNRHQSSKIRFGIYRKNSPGRRLLYHYTPIARGAMTAWDSMSKICTAINNIIDSPRDLTRENIVTTLNRISITPVNYYRAVLSECFGDLSGVNVFDLYPTSGSRGLAVMLCGGNYFQTRKMFETSLNAIASKYGLPKTGIENDHYDFMFLSRDRPLKRDIVEERISKYGCMADQALVMIQKEDRNYLTQKFKTNRVLRISGMAETANDDNYLLIIDQR